MTKPFGQTSDEYTALGSQLLSPNYGPAPLTFVSGKGVHLVDVEGREYLDFGSGISVTSFGHGNPAIHAAATSQLGQIWHTSNLYHTRPPLELAAALIDRSIATRVFFCNSGAEANEAAIKLVRKAASASRTPDKRVILTFRGGFHGRTLATISATAREKYQAGFEPLPTGFRYCPFNDVDALEQAFDESVCGVMFEPIQGEGGINIAEPAFVQAIQTLAHRHQAFVMVDEIQCGMSRTGRLWAYEWYPDFCPDVVTSAKALGGGLPIGAVLIGDKLKDVLQPGSHGSTFGGNPVSCAAALAALQLAGDPALQRNVLARGEQLVRDLARINQSLNVFSEIRGRGLMIGAQLRSPYDGQISDLVVACRQAGLLVLQAGEGVLRLLPPLTITGTELAQGTDLLSESLETLFGASSP